jgi:type IV secretory pathway TraG/TraD family ATPase VirD4
MPFSVFVDEFDAFAFPAFATFLNKGRSSDFMIHLAHQTLSDLDRVGPAFRGQIMGNMNVRFIFRQDEPDDAEAWSRFFGTRTTTKRTFQTQDGQRTGAASNRITQEFRVAPDTIKDLKTGQCVFSMKSPAIQRVLQIPYSSEAATSRFSFPSVRPPLGRQATGQPLSEFDRKLNPLQDLKKSITKESS